MRPILAFALLAVASGTSAKAEYLGSGWPIDLAENACRGNEICLTKLANCGPGDTTCASGVSICDISLPGEHPAPFPCQSDRITDPAGTVVMVPRFHLEEETHDFSAGQDTLFFATSGFSTLNGQTADITAPGCLLNSATNVTYCARQIRTQTEADNWLETQSD